MSESRKEHEQEQDARGVTIGSSTDSPTASTAGSSPHAHTPGPWHVVGPTGYIFTDGDPYGRGQMHVAMVRGWGHLTGTGGGCAFDEDKAIAIQEANARLIAAAPDLLEAVQALLLRAERELADPVDVGEVGQARAALLKATGQ